MPSFVKSTPADEMPENGSSRRINLHFATETPAQNRTIFEQEVTAALRDVERYCDQQLNNRIPTPNGYLITEVRTILDKSLFILRQLVNTSVFDMLVGFEQQISSRMDEQTSAIKQELEHLKDGSIRLRERITLCKRPKCARPEHIAYITALRGEIAGLKLKINTVPSTEATLNLACCNGF